MLTEGQAPLPVWLVAGPHSGRNAEWIAAAAPPGQGRWLWLVGALQRPLASAALDRVPAAVRERLLLDGLPGGCPCCAAGVQLAAGLARLLRRHRREGRAITGLILQIEPEGDPARLADNLLGTEIESWLRIDTITAVVSAEDLAGAVAPGRSSRTMRCLGAARRVWLRESVTRPVATRLGPDWSGALVPVSEAARVADPDGPTLALAGAGAGWTVLDHDPFGGGSAGGEPWQPLARWPASVRFDRRAVPAWLEDLGRRLALATGGWAGAPVEAAPVESAPVELAPVELALIARTERDWLGWQPGAAEMPLAWRSDSRLVWRRSGRTGSIDGLPAIHPLPAFRPLHAAGHGKSGHSNGAQIVTGSVADDLPADIIDGLTVAPLLVGPT